MPKLFHFISYSNKDSHVTIASDSKDKEELTPEQPGPSGGGE